MAKGVNKVILIGNLGADPDVRYAPNESVIANITLATSENWRDKQSGEQQERTEWHRVIFFNRLAEIVRDYLRKGAKIYVEGALRTRKWQDKAGLDRYTTEIVATEMQMLDRKGDENEMSGSFVRPTEAKPETHLVQETVLPDASPVPTVQEEAKDLEDDIPF